MNNFFDINSVAIVGASEQEGKLGNKFLKYLKSFPGKKYGINPKGGKFEGIKFYESISDLPEIVSILVFVIPAKLISNSLQEAGKKGIKRAIIISAGFKEVGNTKLENEIKKIAKENDIMLLGPNCLGYVDSYKSLNLSFGTKEIKKGNISIISQSGAMAVAITDWALKNNLGFSKIITLGNKAGIDEVDLLLELENDEKTKVIAVYLESIERGELFFQESKRISKIKPIVLIKSGISDSGKKAASSHTGAISSDEKIFFTAFYDAGIHFTNSLEEYFLWMEIFSKIDYKNISGDLTIITNAGGPGVVSIDYAEKIGINLSKFDENEKDVLKKEISDSASLENPLDIIGDATSKTYKQILNNFLKLDKKRDILLLLTAQSVTDVENIAEVISKFQQEHKKQFLMTSFIGGKGVKKGIKILKKNNVLHYDFPEKALLSYKKLLIQKENNKNESKNLEIKYIYPKKLQLLEDSFKNEEKLLSDNLLGEIFDSFDINYLKNILVTNEKEAVKIFDKIQKTKLVAKICSPDIAHKSDVGGIILDIKDEKEALKAYKNILENAQKYSKKSKVLGVSFEPMLDKNSSREIFLGFKRDESFGNIMILGMGGIYVNVFEDVQMKIGIVSKKEIGKMLEKLKYFPILKGARGEKSIDFKSLVEIIFKLQFIFEKFTKIKEIDINPIICNEKESVIVDAKFYL